MKHTICALVIAAATAGVAGAEDGGELFRAGELRALAADEAPVDAWRAETTAWIWLTSMTGDVGVRNIQADVSASFGDILEASDSLFVFSGRVEFGKGPWSGFVDGMYANIGTDDQSGPAGITNIDVTVDQAVLDFGAMYRVAEWDADGEAAKNGRSATTLDIYAGGRYCHLDIELAPATLPTASRSEGWVDPIIGAKLVLPIAESWHLAANADIGGFGVESDFTWSVTGVFGYDFSMFDLPASILFGYRAIGWDYSEGTGADTFQFEVVQHGPIVGLSLRF